MAGEPSELIEGLSKAYAEIADLKEQRADLLAALQKLDEFFETYRPEGHPASDPHELVRAAIAKAEGRS